MSACVCLNVNGSSFTQLVVGSLSRWRYMTATCARAHTPCVLVVYGLSLCTYWFSYQHSKAKKRVVLEPTFWYSAALPCRWWLAAAAGGSLLRVVASTRTLEVSTWRAGRQVR